MEALDLNDPKECSDFADKLLKNLGQDLKPGKATITLIHPCHTSCTDMYATMLGARVIEDGLLPSEGVPACVTALQEGVCKIGCHQVTMDYHKCFGTDEDSMRIWYISEV